MKPWIAVFAVLLAAASAGAQVMADAYSIRGPGGAPTVETFDSMGRGGTKAPGATFLTTYWSARSGNSAVEWATTLNNPEGTGPNHDAWGGAESCYNAAGIPTGATLGELDRTLAVYKSQPTANASLTVRLRNDTGAAMTAFTFAFDHEARWFRFADPAVSGQHRTAELRVEYSFDGLTWHEAVVHAGTAQEAQARSSLDNLGIAPSDAADETYADMTQGWLTESRMEALDKVHRGVGGVVNLAAPLAAGGNVYLRWDGFGGDSGSGTPGDPKDANILHGVDNFRLVGGALPGDIDVDGTTGLADLSILAGNYGTTGRYWGQGDLDGDGTVGLADLSTLAGHYGQDAYAAAVPEPSVVVLLVLVGGAARVGSGRTGRGHGGPCTP